MVKAKRKPAKGTKPKVNMKAVRSVTSSYEQKLVRMVTDPCGAELVSGLGLATHGICQRFVRYITPVATTENAFALIWNPNNQSPTSAITLKVAAAGVTSPGTTTGASPGEAFLEANAEAVATLGACIEVMYTGKLTDRQGYIGICQAPWFVLNDIAAGTASINDIMTYVQAVEPVPSSTVELKWAPILQNFLQNGALAETGSRSDGNGLMVVAIGVEPSKFIIKLTQAVEYVPKNINGIPAPRVTKTVPPGTAERVVSTLDRIGAWWHNVGETAQAANRLGGRMLYAANQVARFAGNARAAIGPATTLLALTG